MKPIKKILLVLFILILSNCAASPEEMSKQAGGNKCVPLKDMFDINSLNSNYGTIGIPTGATDPVSGLPIRKGIVQWITEKIEEVLAGTSKTDGAAETIFKKIGENKSFKRLVGLAITLSIMFYAMSVMLGLAQANGYQALVFSIKLIIIYALSTNWDLFYEYVGETFEALVNSMIEYAGGTFTAFTSIAPYTGNGAGAVTINQNTSLIGNIDQMISVLWNMNLIKLILALMFTGFTGFFWGIMMLALIFLYLFAIISAVKTYLLAMVGRYVLYAIAPLFLIFALFSQTKSLFDNWLKTLISFSLEPIFLFIFLGMFQMILGGMMQQVYLSDADKSLANSVNFDETCVMFEKFDKVGGSDINFWKLCRKDPKQEGAGICEKNSVKPNIPLDIWVIISCLIICYLMFSMLSWITGVANSLAGGVITVSDAQVPGFDKVGQAVSSGGRDLMSNVMKPQMRKT
jgi:type IV secretory pathway VirB6-like protein